MTNKIPHIIHLFWAGSQFPEYLNENLQSYLINLPEDWQIYLWVTDKHAADKLAIFHSGIPSCLIIKDIYRLLQSNIFEALSHDFFEMLDDEKTFYQVKNLVEKELIGLGNLAAAKDVLVNVILYAYGGYYFDFDSKAKEKIKPPTDARLGVLLLNNGASPVALAAEPRHPFCGLALLSYYEYCLQLPQILQMHKDKIKHVTQIEHYHQSFLNLDILRNRKELFRNCLTCMTSGAILPAAFKKYRAFLSKSLTTAEYEQQINFVGASENQIAMGVLFDFSDSSKKQKAKTTDQPAETKSIYKQLKYYYHQLKNNFFKRPHEFKLPAVTAELTNPIKNWREDQEFNHFEYEDLYSLRKR